jgi:hypothetical protein
VGRNADDRLEILAVGDDNALWQKWQVTPNAGWSVWESLGKPKDRYLSEALVQKNADGHLEVFAPGNGAFCNRWQEQPLNILLIKWRRQAWNEKPKIQTGVGLTWLEAELNFQNRLEVLPFGDDGDVWNAQQVDQPSFWRAADHLTIGTNQDRRLEVFLVGQNGIVWNIRQTRYKRTKNAKYSIIHAKSPVAGSSGWLSSVTGRLGRSGALFPAH